MFLNQNKKQKPPHQTRSNMKKLISFSAGIFLLFLFINVNAQTQTGADYFLGKWNVLFAGLPSGDTRMIVDIEKGDTTLTGSILDSTKQEVAKFSKVEMKDTSVTVYFTAQGYDVYVTLNKKDDDHVTGTMLDMFDATGVRVKEEEENK
jgi:hypothetical protein